MAIKIGLIAMSGVRCHNRELSELGMTLPGVLERGRVVASLPSLGLLTLGGMTPDTFELAYVDVPDIDDLDGSPGDFDLVAISSFSAQIKDAYRLAERYRAQGTKVVLGGLHVTALPEEAMQHADAIVLGEGEITWSQLLGDVQRNRLKRTYDGRGGSFDLSNAPMPAFDLLDIERYNRLTVQTQRGCPFDCEFCAASIRISPKFKTKPVEKVIAEIRQIKRRWKQPDLEFADDNTFVNKRHGKNLMRALARENIRWFTETDISVAEDDELLALMRESGCAQILVGFEALSRPVLDGLETSANWKLKQLDRYKSAIDRIQGRGISVNGCFVLGLDGARLESFDEILHFVEASGLYQAQITIQTPFPGTPLYHRLRDEGRLLNPVAWELCTLFDVNFVPERMSVAQLETGIRDLAKKLYSAEATRARKQRFLETLHAYSRGRNSRHEEVSHADEMD